MSVRQYSTTNMTVGDGFVNNPDRVYLEEFFDKKPYVNAVTHSAITAQGATNTNTTTKTSLSSITLPANSLIAGDIIHIQGVGKVNNANGADTSIVALEFGSTNNTGGNVIITSSAYNVNAGDDIHLNAFITIRTIGSGGTCIGNGELRIYRSSAVEELVINITLEISIDTTVPNYLSLNNTWSFAHANNQIAADTFTMDVIHPNGTTPCEHLEITGSNAKNSCVAYSTTEAGLTFTTDGADNDQVILIPHSDSTQTAWNNMKFGTENQVEWECALRTGASIADMSFWGGLKLTNVGTYVTDSNQAYFLYASNDDMGALTTNANLYFVYSLGGNDYITNLGLAVAINTTYKLRIVINSDRKVTVYVNGTQYGLVTSVGENTVSDSTQLSSALNNDIDLLPFIGVQALTGSSKAITVCYEKISRVLFE